MYGGLNTYACKDVLNPNIPIFQPNCAKGLHFNDFHYLIVISHCSIFMVHVLKILNNIAVKYDEFLLTSIQHVMKIN